MSRVVMKMLSPIKCLRVFLKEGTSSGWAWGSVRIQAEAVATKSKEGDTA